MPVACKNYALSEVCCKVRPVDVEEGHFKLVHVQPQIVCFVLARRDVVGASKATRDFLGTHNWVECVLCCPHDPPAGPPLMHFDFWLIPDSVMKEVQHTATTATTSTELAQRLVMECVKNPPLGELAINRFIVWQLQRVLGNKGLKVSCLTSDLFVTCSSSSRVDLAIFHETNFIVEKNLHGVAIHQPDEKSDESDDSDDTCLYGAAGELKLADRTAAQELAAKKQLMANMEMVAGELALRACRMEKIFNKIIIYGVLVDTEGQAHGAKLNMDFLTTTAQLEWNTKSTHFNTILASLCSVLGCH